MHDYWTLMKKLIWLRILQGASFVVNKITGTSPITLTNAINSAIISLKQYGKCVQDGTSPVNIMCNNGTLKWDSVNQRIYADGTPEVVTLSASGVADQTATVENLYAVDNITDEQDIITGKVIRRTEAVVSDGTTPSGRYVGEVGVGNIIVKARETGYSGEIVSFTTEEETPLNGLRVNFEPIQDLHGYDAPWPAGGGSNIIDVFQTARFNSTISQDGLTLTSAVATASGNYNFVGAFTKNNFHVLAGDKLYVSFDLKLLGGTAESLNFQLTNNSVAVAGIKYGVQPTAVGERITAEVRLFNSLEEADVYGLYCQGVTLSDCQIQISNFKIAKTADYVWTPYSNLCPISGHTNGDVTRTGKNLYDNSDIQFSKDAQLTSVTGTDTTLNGFPAKEVAVVGSTTSWGWRIWYRGIRDIFKPNTTYTFTWLAKHNNNTQIICGNSGGAHKLFQKTATVTNIGNGVYRYTATATTPPADDEAWAYTDQVITPYANDISKVAGTYYFSNLIVVVGSVPETEWSAYTGTTYPIPLGTTVYGGTLDVVTGVLTVDRISQTVDQNSGVARLDDNRCYVAINEASYTNTDGTKADGHIISDKFENVPNNVTATTPGIPGVLIRANGSHQAVISMRGTGESLISVADWNAWLTNNPVQIVYELATPQTIQLTPAQVELLLGENNIWSDANSINVYVSDGELIVQVAPQKLKTAKGTNVVEVTSNVDPVTLEVEYKINR